MRKTIIRISPKRTSRGIHSVELDEENGEWKVYINGSKNGLPATDVEIYLWKQLQENREQAARQTSTTK